MAQHGNSDDLVTLQGLTISNACEIAALAAVLERKGVSFQPEMVEQSRRMKEEAGTRGGLSGSGKHERRTEP